MRYDLELMKKQTRTNEKQLKFMKYKLKLMKKKTKTDEKIN